MHNSYSYFPFLRKPLIFVGVGVGIALRVVTVLVIPVAAELIRAELS